MLYSKSFNVAKKVQRREFIIINILPLNNIVRKQGYSFHFWNGTKKKKLAGVSMLTA